MKTKYIIRAKFEEGWETTCEESTKRDADMKASAYEMLGAEVTTQTIIEGIEQK